MTTPTASCKNLKPKIPENLPNGYYFYMKPSTNRYGRATVVVTLYRERRFWFDERFGKDEFEVYLAYGRLTEYAEIAMSSLVNKLRVHLYNQKYLYGRHP